jgi:hypothetical protein
LARISIQKKKRTFLCEQLKERNVKSGWGAGGGKARIRKEMKQVSKRN